MSNFPLSPNSLGIDFWKQLRNEFISSQNSDNDESLSTHLLSMQKLLFQYMTILQDSDHGSENDVYVRDQIEYKNLVLECRHALRYLITIFLVDEKERSTIQEVAVLESNFHVILCKFLVENSADSKCLSLAAKILCNLVTGNPNTAFVILTEIKPSLSTQGQELFKKKETFQKEIIPPSWSELIHSTATNTNFVNRETVGAVVATLHNSILAIRNDENYPQNGVTVCLQSLTTDKILMCNLVRYILPKETIQPLEAKDMSKEEKMDLSDDATVWISLLLELFCAYGLFKNIYDALGSSCVDSNENGITPEQIVLLNCLSGSTETYLEESKSLKTDRNPFGSKSVCPDGFHLTIHSLAQLWLNLRKSIRNENRKERFDGENKCIREALKITLDILGTALSSDYSDVSKDEMSRIRTSLGQEVLFLNGSLIELGLIVDKLSVENTGLKARELVVSKDEQRLMIGLMRVLGNLCYQCKENQDLVRETNIPFYNKSYLSIENQDNSNERNGLHVMLTCTSFAHGCFTLREWGIVAIRNMLDNNDRNQQEVAKLEAQQVINTPELAKYGVKLNLDEKGKVHVTKTDDKTSS